MFQGCQVLVNRIKHDDQKAIYIMFMFQGCQFLWIKWNMIIKNNIFLSSYSRVPVGGMQEMSFKITKLKVNTLYHFTNNLALKICMDIHTISALNRMQTIPKQDQMHSVWNQRIGLSQCIIALHVLFRLYILSM